MNFIIHEINRLSTFYCSIVIVFFSIFIDGIMVQVTSDTMKKIRTAMKEMQDLIIPASEGSNEAHKLKIIWGSSDDSTPRFVN